jgi:deazaflavin-dependent oxidoreductase (nitroreductase family)
VLVETTGARSGEQRDIPLLALRLGDTMAVSTVRSRSQWIANVEAEPKVDVWLFRRMRPATSRVVTLGGVRVAVLQLEPTGTR